MASSEVIEKARADQRQADREAAAEEKRAQANKYYSYGLGYWTGDKEEAEEAARIAEEKAKNAKQSYEKAQRDGEAVDEQISKAKEAINQQQANIKKHEKQAEAQKKAAVEATKEM